MQCISSGVLIQAESYIPLQHKLIQIAYLQNKSNIFNKLNKYKLIFYFSSKSDLTLSFAFFYLSFFFMINPCFFIFFAKESAIAYLLKLIAT